MYIKNINYLNKSVLICSYESTDLALFLSLSLFLLQLNNRANIVNTIKNINNVHVSLLKPSNILFSFKILLQSISLQFS